MRSSEIDAMSAELRRQERTVEEERAELRRQERTAAEERANLQRLAKKFAERRSLQPGTEYTIIQPNPLRPSIAIWRVGTITQTIHGRAVVSVLLADTRGRLYRVRRIRGRFPVGQRRVARTRIYPRWCTPETAHTCHNALARVT